MSHQEEDTALVNFLANLCPSSVLESIKNDLGTELLCDLELIDKDMLKECGMLPILYNRLFKACEELRSKSKQIESNKNGNNSLHNFQITPVRDQNRSEKLRSRSK